MPLKVLVTGFGEFHGVARNPTQHLVQYLGSTCNSASPCSQAASSPSPGSAPDILSTTVLRVSAAAVDDFLREQLPQLQHLEHATGDPIVLLHFGVDGTRDIISLESVAANEATFRVPDQDGWQPTEAAITDTPAPCTCLLRAPATAAAAAPNASHHNSPSTGMLQATTAGTTPAGAAAGAALCATAAAPAKASTTTGIHQALSSSGNGTSGNGAAAGRSTPAQPAAPAAAGSATADSSSCCLELKTSLPLAQMQQLLSAAGFNCQVSCDAGRFVCNWTYFRSLQAAATLQAATGRPCHALFVHMPHEQALPLQQQEKFAEVLLRVLAECCEQGGQVHHRAAAV